MYLQWCDRVLLFSLLITSMIKDITSAPYLCDGNCLYHDIDLLVIGIFNYISILSIFETKIS